MNKIEIYTKNLCSFCDKAKIFFKSKKLNFIEYNIDKDLNFLDSMLKKSKGQQTVPQIFINNTHIGGFDKLKILINSGKFDKMINS